MATEATSGHGRFLILALVVSILWGLNPVLLKSVMTGGIDSHLLFVMSGFFYMCCLAAFVAWNWTTLRSHLHSVTWATMGIVAFTAATTSFMAMLIYVTLLRDNPSNTTTALTCTAPLFTLVLAWAFLGEQLSALGCVGVVMIVSGVALVAWK